MEKSTYIFHEYERNRKVGLLGLQTQSFIAEEKMKTKTSYNPSLHHLCWSPLSPLPLNLFSFIFLFGYSRNMGLLGLLHMS